MFGIDDRCMRAIQDYYRSVVQAVRVYQPRGDGADSQQALNRAAEAIRAMPLPHDADPEIVEAVEDQRRTVLRLIEGEVSNPLHPERRSDPYGWLCSTITDRAHNAETFGRQ